MLKYWQLFQCNQSVLLWQTYSSSSRVKFTEFKTVIATQTSHLAFAHATSSKFVFLPTLRGRWHFDNNFLCWFQLTFLIYRFTLVLFRCLFLVPNSSMLKGWLPDVHFPFKWYRNPTAYAILYFHVSASSAEEGSKQKGTKYGPGGTGRPAINRASSVWYRRQKGKMAVPTGQIWNTFNYLNLMGFAFF